MRVQLMLCVVGITSTACMNDGSAPPTAPGIGDAIVFEIGPHKAQCAPPTVTRVQSASRLTSAGVEVRRSSCGVMEGVAFPAVCGAGTGELLLHDIPATGLAAAKAAGFTSVDELDDWRRVPCPQYLHAIEVAQSSTACADIRNRVLTIRDELNPDDRVVLLDQAGKCADAAYQQVLFGDGGERILCSNADSIAGPQKSCPEPSRAAMFDTILQNLAQPDLGLGSRYQVAQVYPVS